MQIRQFSWIAVAALTLPAVEVWAQQGPMASANPAATSKLGRGIGNGSGAGTARGDGALRTVGKGSSSHSRLVGAQFDGGEKSTGRGQGSANSRTLSGSKAVAEPRSGLSLHSRGRADMAARSSVGDRPTRSPVADVAKSETTAGTSRVVDGTAAPWERSGVTRADWLLAKRLASIDRMRDIAVQNGSERQLEQADKLEAIAREQHQRRTGEFAEPEPAPNAGSAIRPGNEPVPSNAELGTVTPVSTTPLP